MQTYTNLTVQQYQAALIECSGKRIAIDTETTGLHWWSDNLITIGFFCPDADICGSIDIRDLWSKELQNDIKKITKESLAPGTAVMLHNAKFDLHFLDCSPLETGWNIVDTTVLIHLLDSRYPKGMEKAEKILLGENSKREHIDATKFDGLPLPVPLDPKASKRKKAMVWDWNKDKRQEYCINDCKVTYQFAEVLLPAIKKMDMGKLFQKDMQYLSILYEIEKNGILINPVFIAKAAIELSKHQEELEKQLFDACGKTFNWHSTKQLSKAIYEDMGINKPLNPFVDSKGNDKTKFVDRRMYNETCTSTFILMEKAHHPLGELINALREASKLIKTLQQWQELSDAENYIHTNFNLTGTRTGRLSSSQPNLQNTPAEVRSRFASAVFSGGNILRTEEYNLRNAFIARPGYKFLSIDWKQMEMRMFGILSGDNFLISALRSGVDIHTWIATQVWGECDAETMALHRDWSKAITFGLVYGMTTGGLQFKLEMTREQAVKVSEDYWSRFPRIKPWMMEVINYCRKNGYVKYWSNRIWREEQESQFYKSANALIQGGCADLLSIAVIRVFKWLQSKGKNWGRIVNLVHDEIIVEIPENSVISAAIEMAKIMEVEDLFSIPFLVDCKMGDSYGRLEKLKLPQE